MRRTLWILFLALLGVGSILFAAGWYLLQDEEFLKTRLHAVVLKQTGRELAIDGPLRLDLAPETTIEAHGIRLQNAAWADGDDMLSVGHLRLSVDLRSLFAGTPVISSLLLEDCELLFARAEDGASNWQLRPDSVAAVEDEAEPGPAAILHDGQVNGCRLRFTAPDREQPLTVGLDTFRVQLHDGERLQASGSGRVDDEALSLSGEFAPLSALLGGGPLQYEAQAKAGDIELHSSGGFLDVRGGRGADLEMRFHGPDVARLLHYFGLPDLSQGAFDFRLDLDAQGVLTRLELDGNLGSLQARAEGELDRLSHPTQGRLNGVVTGPDLEAIGRALGVSGLTAEAYTLQANAGFEAGLVRIQALSLASAGDRLVLSGVLGTDTARANSDLEFTLEMQQAARLAAVFGKQLHAPRPLMLSGRLQTDAAGLTALRARADYLDSVLAVDGTLGAQLRLAGSEFEVQLDTPDVADLALLFDRPGFPHEPLVARGQLHNTREGTRLEAVELSSGTLRAAVDGRLLPGKRFDLTVRTEGPDAGELQPLVRVALPPEPFTLQARVAGAPSAFELTGLEARLGESRASGDLAISLDAPRRISGKLRSPLLDLSHWTDQRSQPDPAPADESAPPPAFVFDDTPVTRIIDYGVELDLDLGAAVLDLGQSQIRDIELGAKLTGQKLELRPFSLRGTAGGLLSGRATLDDSGDKPQLDLELLGRDMRLGFAAFEGQDSATIPATELHLRLAGKGDTERELASGLSGKLRFYQGPGLVAAAGVQLLFSDFLTELLNVLNPLAEKSPYTQIDCSAAAADIVDGQVTVGPVVFNTRQLTFFSQGSIDLRTEQLDLSFNTKPRQGLGLSTSVLINPFIKVGGRLAEPAIELDPKGAAVRGGTAVATAGLSLLARSISDRFLSSKDPCGDVRKEIEKRDG
ncbi:MAG: AsmA family protein [Lysobacterales bacterium]